MLYTNRYVVYFYIGDLFPEIRNYKVARYNWREFLRTMKLIVVTDYAAVS